MDDAVVIRGEARPQRRKFFRRGLAKRLLNELFALFIALLIILMGALVLLDTAPGHRFVVDRIARIETASGLKFRIGRIDGSIFGQSTFRNVAVADQQGVFLTSPEIDIDWSPAAWLANTLAIDSVTAERVTLLRAPRLKPSTKKGPILPGFDIRIGELRIDRLDLAPAVGGGKARSGRLSGKADVRSGRALVQLYALIAGGGDRVAFNLDAEPDRNRFDIGARIASPADGLIPAIVGIRRSIDLDISGDGDWSRWRGRAALDLAGRPTARLALGVDSGRYRLEGKWAPAQFLKGRLQRLTTPVVAIRGDATLKDRILDGQMAASSPQLRAVARGSVNLADNSFDDLRLGVDLLKPQALFNNMTGRNVRMVWTLDGRFATADYSYRLTSPGLKFDDTGFIDFKAEGRGRLSPWPMRVPLRLSARAITGIGDVAGAILANPKIEGWLTVTPKLVRGDKLKLTSAKVNGQLSLLIDLVTGRFEVTLSGRLNRYLIPGLGIVDVITDLRVVPGPGGKGSRVVGTAKAWVRRLDNRFFADLMGSLPRLETNLERGPDGVLHLSNLQLYSSKLRLSGSGRRNRDGTFHIEAKGHQAKYGPLRMVLDGRIERPKIDLFLDRPNDSLGLRGVRLLLDPVAVGFNYRATGQSKLGPFTSNGQILLPPGRPTVIAIAALDVGGAHANGQLRSDPGGFSGPLNLTGGSLLGTLAFAPVGGAQQIEAHLNASGARFPMVAVRSGRIDGTILLGEQTTVSGTVDARGVETAGLTLARLRATARLTDGRGEVQANFAGRRGADFAFSTIANISPDQIRLTGNGKIEGEPLVLREEAVLTKTGDGWALSPTSLTFAGGSATVSGQSGSRPRVHADVRAMPLQVLDIFWPKLDLSGSATGSLDYAWAGVRNGRLNLKVRGLSRSGLVLASKPIDVGIIAAIDGDSAAMRAVAASDGKTVGKAQARFAPLGNGPLAAELLNAPLFAQLRYSGPADTLWRLSGTEVFDLSGPIAIGADVTGRAADPRIRGSLRTNNARLESAVTGMVIDKLDAQARFSGPELIFTRLSGNTSGGGSLSGTGSVRFTQGKTALNLTFTANQALLLNRDDIAARVSGPVTIRSDGSGGTIGGKLHLDKGQFRLGRAAGAADIPSLNVRNVGLDPDEIIESRDLTPWRLDIALQGRDLKVTGLGIDSLWSTNLQIGGLANAPRFTGRADLIRGDYDFAGRNFRLERGIIRFGGESPPDPQLDIRASAQVQGLDANVIVQGTGQRPEISFASTPPLPQDELLSRILFGTSITNLSAPEALQLAAAVASLRSGGGGLDPINSLRKAIGLDRLRIVPADVATGQHTAIAAGKYITRKLFVEVVTDGQGYSATRVEYQVSKWLSLLSTVSTIGRTSAAVRVSKDY